MRGCCLGKPQAFIRPVRSGWLSPSRGTSFGRELNVEPLLDPQLKNWLEQLESFIPGLFESRRKIYLDNRWKSRLQIERAVYWLEVPINVGIVNHKVRLYEWRIGHSNLNWQDRVKLWVACQYLQYQPKDLTLVISAFSPNSSRGKVKKITWSPKQHQLVEKSIKALLRKNPLPPSQQKNPIQPDHSQLTDIEAIDEVSL